MDLREPWNGLLIQNNILDQTLNMKRKTFKLLVARVIYLFCSFEFLHFFARFDIFLPWSFLFSLNSVSDCFTFKHVDMISRQ